MTRAEVAKAARDWREESTGRTVLVRDWRNIVGNVMDRIMIIRKRVVVGGGSGVYEVERV